MHKPDVNPLLQLDLATEAETLALGTALAPSLRAGMVLFLCGDLGAGKTTLARGILRGLGHRGRVKSPTFALVEVYKLSSLYLYHFDFYRFGSGEEWRTSGLQEHFNPDTLCLVEWPENATGLPTPDLAVHLAAAGSGRKAEIEARTEAGKLCLERLKSSRHS